MVVIKLVHLDKHGVGKGEEWERSKVSINEGRLDVVYKNLGLLKEQKGPFLVPQGIYNRIVSCLISCLVMSYN